MPSKNLNEEDKIFADIMKMISKSNKKDVYIAVALTVNPNWKKVGQLEVIN